jgi:hypothetical protein
MKALENAGRRSWVKTYPLCPKARVDETGARERKRHIQRPNGGFDLYARQFLMPDMNEDLLCHLPQFVSL